MNELSFDVAIIGAGTAGMGAARAAAQHNVTVALIEANQYGTTCARVGCMPSKLLIAAAEAVHDIEKAPAFGIEVDDPRIDGCAVMDRVRSERDRFVGFVLDAIENDFPSVDKFQGHARFVNESTIQIDTELKIRADQFVIATGSRPAYPAVWKEELGELLIINDDIFDWENLPESTVVIGAGVVGLELAQALHRLGVRVRLLGRRGSVGPLTDPAIVDYAAKSFAQELPFDPDADVRTIYREADSVNVTFVGRDGVEKTEAFQYLLAATGRRPNVDDLGLESTPLVRFDNDVLDFDRTTTQVNGGPFFIAGDANNDVQLLHEAADEGRIAGDNAALFPDVRRRPRRAGLSVVFSDPQIAIAGMSLDEIKSAKLQYSVGEVSFEGQGRSRVMLKNKGLLRVYGECISGRFLGAEMFGPSAEHIAHLLSWSAQSALTVRQMLDCPYYHPVIEEGLRTALRQLNLQLKMGPVPVEHCLDCGPGA